MERGDAKAGIRTFVGRLPSYSSGSGISGMRRNPLGSGDGMASMTSSRFRPKRCVVPTMPELRARMRERTMQSRVALSAGSSPCAPLLQPTYAGVGLHAPGRSATPSALSASLPSAPSVPSSARSTSTFPAGTSRMRRNRDHGGVHDRRPRILHLQGTLSRPPVDLLQDRRIGHHLHELIAKAADRLRSGQSPARNRCGKA